MLIADTPVDTRSLSSWRPLRIVAQMQEPVVTNGDPIHIDGILAWGAYATHPNRDELPPMTSTSCVDFALPLATWRIGTTWGWCASAAQWPVETIRRTEHVRRKPPQHEYIQLTTQRSYDYGVGPAKAVNKPVPTAFARTLHWYALGDEDGVRALLDHVTHIGKLMGHGHGAVLAWVVEVTEADWSIERDGRLMRRMPAGWGGRPMTHRGGLRPPYHHRTRHGDAVGPDDAA